MNTLPDIKINLAGANLVFGRMFLKGLLRTVDEELLTRQLSRLSIKASAIEGHPFYGNQYSQFTGREGGIAAKRVGEGKEAKWVAADGSQLPEHVSSLRIPPAWQNVRVAPTPEHDLQAVGTDAKGREQRIYSSKFTQQQAQEKFSRNQELLEKKDKIFAQNEANLKHPDPKVRENAVVMRLIQHTGIRPGSEADTGASKQAYGATTLEGRHVHQYKDGSVALKFTGKKGVSLNIPVDHEPTAVMLLERKAAAGNKGKLFDTNDHSLREYSHSLDGGGFKPKDFRTLKGTETAMEAVKENPTPAKSMGEYKKRVMSIAKRVSEKLGNTPSIALKSYINPFVFEGLKPA